MTPRTPPAANASPRKLAHNAMDDFPPRRTPADARPTPIKMNVAASELIPSASTQTGAAKLNVTAAEFIPSGLAVTAAQRQFE